MVKKIGYAFSEHVERDKGNLKKKNPDGKSRNFRELFLLLAILLVLCVLLVKIVQMQIFQGGYYRNLSDNNRTKTVIIHAPRGIIFDRNGKELVYNVPGFRYIRSGKTIFLDKNQALSLISKNDNTLEVDTLREYPYKDVLAHVIGFIGQISEDELKLQEYKDYSSSDIVGKMGIEKEYEANLKGTDEKQLVEVDNMGKVIRKMGKTEAISGSNITTTLDINIQKTAYNALKDIKKGVVIVTKTNGEVLALVSKPSFDPNLFTMGENYKTQYGQYKNIEEILLDSNNQPLLNRAISGTYPPGSTFKLIVAAAGLNNNIIDKNYRVEDTGILKIGQFSFANWFFTNYGGKDGSVDVIKAIKRSNDIFFYKLAEKIGVTKISKTAANFGVGSLTGIDLDGETMGILPDPEWKEKYIKDKWYLGDTYHYGIGQGYLLTTPLQVNLWTQVIANKGSLYRPVLLKAAAKNLLKPVKENLLSDASFQLIQQGMLESCQKGGVAWPLFDFNVNNKRLEVDNKNIQEITSATKSAEFKDYKQISIACKTGTAQHGGEKTLPHSWITLFAPAYDPQIVVTVLAEESGEGSNIAAPVAKKVLEEYFSKL